MHYPVGEMLYNDGKYYKWNAKADHDNPYYKGGKDHRELNRTEGYEVKYFIEHSIDKINWNGTPGIRDCQKIEKMIRYNVPSHLKKRELIYDWIINNYNNVSFPD